MRIFNDTPEKEEMEAKKCEKREKNSLRRRQWQISSWTIHLINHYILVKKTIMITCRSSYIPCQ
jgi:hypothetical protein